MKDGEDILDAVSDAILTNDYSHLNDAINDVVHDVTDAISDSFHYRSDGPRRPYQGERRASDRDYVYGRDSASHSYERRHDSGSYGGRNVPRTAFTMHRVNAGEGLGRLIGGICLGLFLGWPMLAGGIVLLFTDIGIALGAILLGLVFSVPSAWLIATGSKKRALAKRFAQYRRYAGNAEFLDIGKLARFTGRSKENTVADIRRMMENGWLPGAWIDPAETTLVLTENAWQQYHQAEMNYRQRQQEQQKQKEAQQNAGTAQKDNTVYSEEVQKIIADGENYRAQIHHANDLIPDEEMSAKLAQLETLLDRIFTQVRRKPETAKDLRSLMNYYLPTTMKLIDAYIELDQQPDAGENIRHTKREIENALDTINAAFEKLLDSLFQDMAWDIESDINVMETMFRRDGLTEDDLQKTKREAAAGKSSEKAADNTASRKTWKQMKQEAGITEPDEETAGDKTQKK